MNEQEPIPGIDEELKRLRLERELELGQGVLDLVA